VVASWAVFRLKHGGRQCWGVQKSDTVPVHNILKQESQE
jgi:hypothetical protein